MTSNFTDKEMQEIEDDPLANDEDIEEIDRMKGITQTMVEEVAGDLGGKCA